MISRLALVGTCSSALSLAAPLAPSYGSTYQMNYDLWNQNEDLITQNIQAQDPVAKKAYFGGYSPVGSYTELFRGDLSKIYMYYPYNGSHVCIVYNYTYDNSPNPFSFAGMPFVGPSNVGGMPANHFRVSTASGSFLTGAYTNANDGSPLRLADPSQQQTWEFTYFNNKTAPPASLFDVPSYCV